MIPQLPEYYFRVRENGAHVFRIDTENRHQRIEMDPIAVINIRNGDVKPQGERILSEADLQAIQDWIATRRDILATREVDDIRRTIDHLNLMTHWANSKATPEQLEAVTDEILLAMHDLRSILVRKTADRLLKAQNDGDT